MTRRLEKRYGDFDKDDFIDCIKQEYDERLITFRGQDYAFNAIKDEDTGGWKWYMCDALELRTKKHPRRLSGYYTSLDDLLNAPELDGRSVIERFDELGKCDWFWLVDDDGDLES